MGKRLFTILVSLLLFQYLSWGTAQEGDILILDGEEWELLYTPLEQLDSLAYSSLQKALEWEGRSTGNYRGYVAYWSIRDGMLYLEKVVMYDEQYLPKDCDYSVILKTLSRYDNNGRICAEWLSGEMIAGRGNIIRYQHMGFDRDYEEEIVVSVTQGAASLSQIFHNQGVFSSNEGRMRLDLYLKKFPSDSYGLDKGHYRFEAKYSTALHKWTVTLLKPSDLAEKDALEKDLAKYINDSPEEFGDYIRGEWIHHSFSFGFSIDK